jgi:hypothetical protein
LPPLEKPACLTVSNSLDRHAFELVSNLGGEGRKAGACVRVQGLRLGLSGIGARLELPAFPIQIADNFAVNKEGGKLLSERIGE